MGLLLRHKLLVGAVALVAAVSAGGAYAATQSSTNPRQAYLADVAKRLNVSPAKLRAALKGAYIDGLNAAVKRGQLTQAQANKIEQRIAQGGRLPFMLGAPARGFGFRGRPLLIANGLDSAASYLGLTDAKLLSDLGSGKSLADIAKAQGKSVSGLEQAIIGSETTRLNKLEASGLLTKTQEQRVLSRLSKKVDRLVARPGLGPLMKPMPGMRGLPKGPLLPQNGPMMPPAAGGLPAPGFAPPPAT